MTSIHDLQQLLQRAILPDEYLSVSEWSDKYRYLSQKSSAEPGRWRTERTPYLKEIMDNLSPFSPVQKIVFMKGAQIGGTEAGNNWIGYVIDMCPSPMMAVSPTVEMAKRNSKQRIAPLIEESEKLSTKISPARSRDSGNTVLNKEFQGGVLVMTGANSAVGLRSMPARFLFMDEVDGYPGDVEGEGDPILLAERRSSTFQNRRKIFLVSTPTLKGTSRINREFENSDMRFYYVPCPHCGEYEKIEFKNLQWKEGKPEEAEYICPKCGCVIEEHHKTDMLSKGEWRVTGKENRLTVGYHLSSLYSPIGWFSWKDAAILFEKTKNDVDLRKVFVNTVLGEPYEEEYEAPDWKRIYERREIYEIGTVPNGGLFLTAGVDIQKDRIECEVVAWGRNFESWSIEYFVLMGDTARFEVWNKLEEVINKDYKHQSGAKMPIRVMCVDSGYATQDVYNFVRKFPQAIWGGVGAIANQPRTVVAIKGQDRDSSLILSVSKADTGGKRKGLRVWSVSGPVAKLEFYRQLKLDKPTDEDFTKNGGRFPKGYNHFPQYGEEYFKQITSEKRIIRLVKGYPKAYWEKEPSVRNEALDCRVYARAGASIYGYDRFNDRKFEILERALGIKKSIHVDDTENKKIKLKQRKITKIDDPWM